MLRYPTLLTNNPAGSIPFLLLAFPALAVLFASTSFLFGGSIHAGHGLVALGICAILSVFGGPNWQTGFKRLGWFLGIVGTCFLVDSCFIMFSWWDAQAYHIPATDFLVKGWNPVFASTCEQLITTMGADPATFNPYHVAYLPRGGWIYGAITYLMTGNIESGDTLILLSACALSGVAWRTAPILFNMHGKLRLFFTSMVVLAPGFVMSAFCGAQDGSLYCLMLTMLLTSCVYRRSGDGRWLLYTAISLIIGCNLKFTGIVSAVIGGSVFLIPIIRAILKGEHKWDYAWKWIGAYAAGGILALIVGFSPYITNWAEYGGPFYPQHSFNSEIELPAMTEDFSLINDDAKAMGYVGRAVNAYLSKWAAYQYYEWKLDKDDFNPVFHLDQVGGLGAAFRGVMVLTLILACFTRRSKIHWLLIVIVVSSFAQPARYIGYVRYVPQLWMLPVLLAFNGITCNRRYSPIIGRALSIAIITLLAFSTYVIVLGKILTAVGLSVYSHSLVETLREETAPRAYVLSLQDRFRQDRRCLAAWETLPPDIPSPHLFEAYYHRILPEFGLDHVDWQTPEEMSALLTADTPRFYIAEHMWVWPRNPNAVRCPEVHYYAGHPRKYLGVRSFFSLARSVLPEVPAYLSSVLSERWKQFKHVWAIDE